VFFKPPDDARHVVPDGAVGQDEIFDPVGKMRPAFNPRAEAEKNGAASKEGLVVVPDFIRKKIGILSKKAAFTARPFQERARSRSLSIPGFRREHCRPFHVRS
jgi:hypothetical protein